MADYNFEWIWFIFIEIMLFNISEENSQCLCGKAVNIGITIKKYPQKEKKQKCWDNNNCCDWASELDPNFPKPWWKDNDLVTGNLLNICKEKNSPHWTKFKRKNIIGTYTFNFSGYLVLTFPV